MAKISNTDFSHELKPRVSHCTKYNLSVSFSQYQIYVILVWVDSSNMIISRTQLWLT